MTPTGRVEHAVELNDAAVARAFDVAAMMRCNGWIYQVASKSSEACERAVLVGSRKPRVPDDVSDHGSRPRR